MPHRDVSEFYGVVAPRSKKYRPGYPASLFRYLVAHTSRQDTAWDCGTGSGGQAARGLAAHFRRVIATDASERQIAIVDPYPGIEFRCAPAETSGLDDASVDLLTVAQAIHWFDLERFYAEANRVLTPGGVVAAWCYQLPMVERGPLNELVAELDEASCLAPYRPAGLRLVEDGYRSLPFPFVELPAPEFFVEENWLLDSFIGYLCTWQSIVDSEDNQAAADFVRGHMKRIGKAWKRGRRTRRTVRWKLHLRVGRTPGP